MIKVPGFPRKFSEEELEETKALKNYEIIILDPDQILTLSGFRNEQISAQKKIGDQKKALVYPKYLWI